MHLCEESHLQYDRLLLRGIEYKISECQICGFIETKPTYPTSRDVYETGHYSVKRYVNIPLLINLMDYIYIYFILLKNEIKRNSFVLDLGCGKGLFLLFLKKLKFKHLVGIETSQSRSEFAKKLTGLDISTDFYAGGPVFNKKYDVITMIHVLEHIENPYIFLDSLINDALNSSGKVFIEVPNIQSLSSRIAGNTWAHFTPEYHVNHFTLLSIITYCSTRDLSIRFMGTFSFYNSAMGMTSAILSKLGYSGSLFEDIKAKKLHIILTFLVCLPITLMSEFFLSFFNQGSIIKCIIQKNKINET